MLAFLLRHATRHHGMLYNVIAMSVPMRCGRRLMTSLGEGKDNSLNKITGKCVMTQFPVMLLNDLSFPSPALATGRIAALWVIGTLATQR